MEKFYLDEQGWLPKPYESNSQIELALKSPERYYKQYFLSAKPFESPQLTFGKLVTDILEGTVEVIDPIIAEQIKNVPRYANTNVELRETITRKSDGKQVQILGYMDAFEEQINHIIDYKTGVEPWDKNRLAASEQFKLYSLLRWTVTKEIPKVSIIWIPTEKVPNPSPIKQLESGFTMRVCGEPVLITHKFSMAELLDSHNRAFHAYDEIKKLSKRYDAENV